ncbi:hypothetical protein [Gemmata sp.]|uniref:hypothetical protein n=1 Tax=Gemmata sp. TaxID=1914242 RepID=UPI003F6EBD94
MGEAKRPIELPVRATLVIDPRDEAIVATWDIEQLRHLVFDICEAPAELVLPEGIRAVVRFTCPTPFDLKAAQLGDDALASVYVTPLPDAPDVQVVARWRDGVASLFEVVVIRRLLVGVRDWQPARAIERAREVPGWILGVCHPARAERLREEAARAGLTAVVEPFTPPRDASPEQFGASWGCEVPTSWPRGAVRSGPGDSPGG